MYIMPISALSTFPSAAISNLVITFSTSSPTYPDSVTVVASAMANGTSNNLDIDLVKKLKSAGMIMVKVGVESAVSDVKKDAKRFSIEEDETFQKIKEIESLGIHVTTMFILGYPKDTIETCRKTINYAKQINSIITQFTVFTPYPGTPAFKEYEKNHRHRRQVVPHRTGQAILSLGGHVAPSLNRHLHLFQ